MQEAVNKRRKAFATTHKSDEYRQTYISVSQLDLSVIAKAKAEAWQATCSSLSPKCVYSLLCSIAGSFSSFSFSPNVPNCSSPRELASVFADYLRTHLSVSLSKALRSRAKENPSELRRATCHKVIIFSALPSPPLNSSRLPQIFSRPLPLAPKKSHIPC